MPRPCVFVCAFLLSDAPLAAQGSRFQPALLERPDVQAAMQSVDARATAIVDEWIKLVEIPAPSNKEQARAEYIRAEMQKLGLTDIRTDDMRTSAACAKAPAADRRSCLPRTWTPCSRKGRTVKVKREGDILRAPGIGDDTSNLMATLEMFRALKRGERADQGRSDLPRVGAGGDGPARREALARNERLQARHVRRRRRRGDETSGTARSASPSTSSSTRRPARTRWRAAAGPAREGRRQGDRRALRDRRCRRSPQGSAPSSCRCSTSACSAAARWSTRCRARRGSRSICARSTRRRRRDSSRRSIATAQARSPSEEGVGFRMEKSDRHRLLEGAAAAGAAQSSARADGARDRATTSARPGTPAIVPADVGSTDANIAVSMGIPGGRDRRRDDQRCTRSKRTRTPAASCRASSRSSRSPLR